LRPLVTVLVVVPLFVKHPQTAGRGLLFELALAGLGIVLGLVATLGFLEVFRDSRDGRLRVGSAALMPRSGRRSSAGGCSFHTDQSIGSRKPLVAG
jgi:hypothetical protein